MTAKELREKRVPLAKRIQELREAIHKEDRDFTTEERANWDAVNKDYDKLTGQIQVAERAEQVDADSRIVPGKDLPGRDDFNGKKVRTAEEKKSRREKRKLDQEVESRGWLASHITEEDRCTALQGWMRRMSGKPPKERHIEAARKCGLKLDRRYLDLHITDTRGYKALQHRAWGMTPDRLETRAQSLNINTAGGYLVPEGFVQNLEVALLAYANVRQFATVMRTASGQDLPWPTVNDTSIKGSIVSENQTLSATSKAGDIAASQMVLHAYKYTSTPAGGAPVLIPVELMEDSAFDLASTVGELLGIRIGRIQADHFTTGTGAAQPTGYITAGTSFAAASATALAADDLYKLKHKVDPAYRGMPGVGFTMHDQILLQIKLLKDGTGRYLWQSSLAGGKPDTIDNDPLFINQSMDSTIASGKKTVAYGALKKYVVRDVSQIRLRRLVERYADSDQEAFVMFTRADGNLLDAGTHPIYYLQH